MESYSRLQSATCLHWLVALAEPSSTDSVLSVLQLDVDVAVVEPVWLNGLQSRPIPFRTWHSLTPAPVFASLESNPFKCNEKKTQPLTLFAELLAYDSATLAVADDVSFAVQ